MQETFLRERIVFALYFSFELCRETDIRSYSSYRVPPAIPPKPSLSALLGLNDSAASSSNSNSAAVVVGGEGGGGVSPLLCDDNIGALASQSGAAGTAVGRSGSSDNLMGNGLTVRYGRKQLSSVFP